MTTIITTREILYRTLRAVSLFMSEDDTRYHLCGICIEVGEPRSYVGGGRESSVHFVATDGHTIGAAAPICRAEGPPCSTILPAAAVESLVKALKPSKLTAELEVALEVAATGHVTVLGGGLGRDDFAPAMNRGKRAVFPPWPAVVPARRPYPDMPPMGSRKQAPVGDGCTAFCINPAYLGRAALAAKYFGCEPVHPRGFHVSVPQSPYTELRFDVDEQDTGSLTVVVAAMRGN